MSPYDPRDVEFVAAVLAAADEGIDCWELLTPDEREPYLTQSNAVLRAIEIAGFLK
ncbi:hypothetical protein KIV66_gp61 [Mycobacterium phage MyraDee]|uniref:Uncharacterized protein n=1 Tax=Mycobacterium phage MyraDee TaxID=2024303 RepID=A0A222YXZ9_9CAUD|nr:hypothetical protein KIV66_gp61 [Mycobacterium phage MyraDee]ASR77168.1 hypothetical protein SEA_MYRADEE_61 [Mycobacterium phage MyraDee]